MNTNQNTCIFFIDIHLISDSQVGYTKIVANSKIRSLNNKCFCLFHKTDDKNNYLLDGKIS
jgi:hypothetical protein